ncbi:GerD family protein [Anaeroselena agilis]|uniref:GerD family protein n=1 Tax=Anaeroselena agilis TaxID=3063788 RepID=A0ABU3NT63_9FIRM|nr:GerD family protein [Selenomonadales bacterium 4137-cl]
MLQKLSPWLAAGLTTGLVVIAGLWLTAAIFFNTFIIGQRVAPDQKMVATLIETGLNNPEVQAAVKQQVMLYLRSPEGKARLAEMIKSPEMVKALAENIQSPEMRVAILKLMEVPEFRAAVLDIVKDTPEMKTLTILSSSIVWDPQPAAPAAEPYY